jgi:Ca-activated chloride channel family protein
MFVCRRIGLRARRLPGTERVTLFRATGIAPCAALSSVLFLTLILPCAWAQSEISEVHVQPRVQQQDGSQAVAALTMFDSGAKPLRVNVDLVLVPVTIMDGMNRLVKGLDRNNFEVYEGENPQDIRYFSSEDAPVSIGIIMDVSGSMASKMERAREAVMEFLNTANPQDEFFMITFSDKPQEASDFTQRVEDVQAKLLYTSPKGRTALLDAVYLGISKMRQAQYQRKALLIISDGGDNHSRYTEREISSLVKEADVMIYAIGIYDRQFMTLEEALGPQLLHTMSEVTGGYAFCIDNPNDLTSVAKGVGIMLRNQYLLGYRPGSVARDGKWHKVKIKLKWPPKLPGAFRVYAKSGYYAPAQ